MKSFIILLLLLAYCPAATLPVTITADAGAGSLRAQIAASISGDTVAITATGTISLTTGEILISGKNLTITGPGANSLTITTNATTANLAMTLGDNFTIRSLTFFDSTNVSISGASRRRISTSSHTTAAVTPPNACWKSLIKTKVKARLKKKMIWNGASYR